MTPPGACTKHPTILKYWDPTRIAVAQTCWRKHWYSNIRGLRSNDSQNIHFEWGHAYHECTRCFDNALMLGMQRKDATQLAFKKAEDLSWDEVENQPRWGSYFMAFRCTDPERVPSKRDVGKQVLNRKRCKWASRWRDLDTLPDRQRCECGRPLESEKTWFNDHPKKNAANLFLAVETYCKDPGLRPYKFPNGDPTTEVQHIIPLPVQSPDGDPYRLVVNMDSIVDHYGWAAIRERKTTGLPKLDFKFWKTYMMGAQTDSYDLVGSIIYADGERIPKLLIEATRLSKAGGEVEIQREVVPISEERRVEWFEELLDVICEAEERALKVLDFGEDPERAFSRNTSGCHGQFGTCPYWGMLCTQASSEREKIIAENFHAEHWDPLTAAVVKRSEE